MGWTDRLANGLAKIFKSKSTQETVKDMVPYYRTLERISDVVTDAKNGDPIAIETVKEVKTRSVLGDPAAQQTVKQMAAVSRVQSLKANKRSFYARGISVGHDPITFGAVRDQRGGSGGGGVSVTASAQPRGVATFARTPGAMVDWRGGKPSQITNYGKGSLRGSPWANWGRDVVPSVTTINPSMPGMKVTPGPLGPLPEQGTEMPVDPFAGQGYQDPYGQYPQYDPYGGGGGGGYPQSDPYGMYDPYGMMPGLPEGYGYEEPVIDRGGYQQYDPDTDSFYSNNQKQVYDEETGMFMPVQDYNPYAF